MNILGTSNVSLQAAQAWAKARGGHQRYIDVAVIYWDLSPLFNIPPEIPFGQAGKETDKGNYTGVVGPERHNWCGMKKETGGDNYDPDAHHAFPDDYHGVLAHLWHLHRYTGKTQAEGPNLPNNDPRYRFVTKFTQTVEGLGGKDSWAPSPSYGTETAKIVTDLRDFANHGTWTQEPPVPDQPYISNLVDIRHLLATASGANRGPTERLPMSQKRGVVVHYRGVVTTPAPGYATFQADARYHVDKNWASKGQPPVYGTGIMYHVGIGFDGIAYQMRDLDRVLWHCGAWPHNADTLAIQIPIGGNQRANAAQLATLERVVNEWCKSTNTPRDQVWGHQELSGTDCPGTLMPDFVLPYRAGTEEQPVDDGRWFPETGHYVGGGFWTYWNERGGLPIFGYPLTDEVLEDGLTVQYFERAVFEYHPENAAPYDILLRRLGADALAARAA